MTLEAQDGEPRAWWERRRLSFSLTVAAGFFLAVILWEVFTPSWAGDRVGLTTATLTVFYGPGALIWIAGANVFFELGRLSERMFKPACPALFRKRAYPVMLTIGFLSFGIWMGLWVLFAWVVRRSTA